MITRVRGLLCSPLIDAAEAFRTVLDQAKAGAGPVHFEWYPYDSLGNMVSLTQLLEHSEFDFEAAVRGKRVLDLGCSDGLFAFFLESLGAQVVAVDHPRSNHNNLAGIATLKGQLRSSVDVRTMDLDAALQLADGEHFELAFAMGLLYHLKNPFLFMEMLSKHSRYCIVSTRVMRRLPGITQDISQLPVAYLLGADELNADNSNFWIFTDASLRRLFQRAHWKVVAWTTMGDTKASTPHTLDHDERAFCLLETTWGELGLELTGGWHAPEDSGWRWTERRFMAVARGSQWEQELVASIFVPDALLALSGGGPVTLEIRVNGHPASDETFVTPGLHTVRRHLAGRGAVAQDFEFAFELSHALAAEPGDPRERGVIVEYLRLD